jgi:hypothetical protein
MLVLDTAVCLNLLLLLPGHLNSCWGLFREFDAVNLRPRVDVVLHGFDRGTPRRVSA